MIMMYPYNYNKWTTVVGDIAKRLCTCVGTGSIWENSVPSSHFRCEPENCSKKKNTLKKCIIKSRIVNSLLGFVG